jgi:hypothetical protein
MRDAYDAECSMQLDRLECVVNQLDMMLVRSNSLLCLIAPHGCDSSRRPAIAGTNSRQE